METRGIPPSLLNPTPQKPMKKLLLTAALLMTTGVAFALSYTYVCPRCGLTQTYSYAGMHRCPNDGSTMIPAN